MKVTVVVEKGKNQIYAVFMGLKRDAVDALAQGFFQTGSGNSFTEVKRRVNHQYNFVTKELEDPSEM